MPTKDFHNRPFDEGTLTKLEIFELYAREWLPVFLSRKKPPRKVIHIFDFFAGPGTDSVQVLGSPLRLLRQLRDYQDSDAWGNVQIHVHFFDEALEKNAKLEENIVSHGLRLPNVSLDIQPLRFEDAFKESKHILADPQACKLVFIDQTGVGHVTSEVFHRLVNSLTCDFLFFSRLQLCIDFEIIQP